MAKDNFELLYDLSLIKEVPQFKIENLKFKICPRRSSRGARPQRKNAHHRDHRGHGGKIFATETQRRGGKMLQALESKMCPCALSVRRETIANAAAQRTGHNRLNLHGA
jgi:hypothetical protein